MTPMIMDHPLIQHKVSLLRDKNTGTKDFRELVSEIAMLMCYEATRDLPLKEVEIETPLSVARTKIVSGKKLAVIAVLRAGLGMVDGVLKMVPAAKVGHVGVYRDPETLLPVPYYCKLPVDITEREALVVDPMLATGGSAAAVIKTLQDNGVKSIKFVCILAAPQGLAHLSEAYPDLPIYCAQEDERLNEHGYIMPGLGDAGDRLFGTK